MDSRREWRSLSTGFRLSRRCAQAAIPLLFAVGGSILFSSAPAGAAPSTDVVYIDSGPTGTSLPLPAGTPDVATPLTTALTTVCQLPLPGYNLAALTAGQVLVCVQPFVGNETFVAGTPNVGVVLPGQFGAQNCGVAVYDFSTSTGASLTVGIEPPGGDC